MTARVGGVDDAVAVVVDRVRALRAARLAAGGASLIASDDAVVAFVSEVEPTCSTKTSSASRTAAAPAMSSALQTIGSTPGMPVTVSAVPFAQPAAGSGTCAPPSPMTCEVVVTSGAAPRQDFDVVVESETLRDRAAAGSGDVRDLGGALRRPGRSASSPIVPWLSAAPTPRPSTDARATAKSLSEPAAVVVEFAVSTLRQTCWFVLAQSGSRMPAWIGCSGPFFVSPSAVSTPAISWPSSARIVMWPW